MKKILCSLIAVPVITAGLTACHSSGDSDTKADSAAVAAAQEAAGSELGVIADTTARTIRTAAVITEAVDHDCDDGGSRNTSGGVEDDLSGITLTVKADGCAEDDLLTDGSILETLSYSLISGQVSGSQTADNLTAENISTGTAVFYHSLDAGYKLDPSDPSEILISPLSISLDYSAADGDEVSYTLKSDDGLTLSGSVLSGTLSFSRDNVSGSVTFSDSGYSVTIEDQTFEYTED